MSNDWLDKLTPQERGEWDDIVLHTREVLPMMEGSAIVMSLAPSGKPDAKYCIELGLAIMLDKPLLVVALAGQPVPARLRRAADEVIEADIDTDAGQRLLAAAVKRMRDREEGINEDQPSVL